MFPISEHMFVAKSSSEVAVPGVQSGTASEWQGWGGCASSVDSGEIDTDLNLNRIISGPLMNCDKHSRHVNFFSCDHVQVPDKNEKGRISCWFMFLRAQWLSLSPMQTSRISCQQACVRRDCCSHPAREKA